MPSVSASYCHLPAAEVKVALALSVGELGALIDSVATLPDVTAGDVDSVGCFSFALIDIGVGPVRAFEAILNETSALELVEEIGRALSGSPRVAEMLARIACGLRMTPADPPGEVTQSVSVTLDGFSTDPRTRRMRCMVRVINRGRVPLEAPMILVLEAKPATVRLVGADGHTCHVFGPGCPFVVLPGVDALAPGAAVERALEFDNPRQESFEIARRVFSGRAER